MSVEVKSLNTSITLLLSTLPSAIYDFKVLLRLRNPSTLILLIDSVFTCAVLFTSDQRYGQFDVGEKPLSSNLNISILPLDSSFSYRIIFLTFSL